MKKLLSVFSCSVLVLALGFAAGCGSGGGSFHGDSASSGGGGDSNDDTVVQGIATPSSVSVVTAQNADQVQ